MSLLTASGVGRARRAARSRFHRPRGRIVLTIAPASRTKEGGARPVSHRHDLHENHDPVFPVRWGRPVLWRPGRDRRGPAGLLSVVARRAAESRKLFAAVEVETAYAGYNDGRRDT